jgi:hypothetical protein
LSVAKGAVRPSKKPNVSEPKKSDGAGPPGEKIDPGSKTARSRKKKAAAAEPAAPAAQSPDSDPTKTAPGNEDRKKQTNYRLYPSMAAFISELAKHFDFDIDELFRRRGFIAMVQLGLPAQKAAVLELTAWEKEYITLQAETLANRDPRARTEVEQVRLEIAALNATSERIEEATQGLIEVIHQHSQTVLLANRVNTNEG